MRFAPLTSLLASLATIGGASPAFADDFQQWAQFGVRVNVSDHIVLHNETIARFSDETGGLYEIENAAMLGYKLPRKLTVWIGYVHNPQYEAGDFTVMERRARQQISIDDFIMFGKASLSARLRFEERWRDGVDGTGWRMRPYAKLELPLGEDDAPTLNITAEPFINLNTTAFQATGGLDRLRSAVSLTVPITGKVNIEAGYLNQHRFVRDGPDRDEHALTAALALSF